MNIGPALFALVLSCLVTLHPAHADSHNIGMTLKVVTGCSLEDNKYSPEMVGIEADKSVNFGLKIQKAIKDKDLEALFSLVNGELWNGPRKAFVRGKRFDEVFATEWQKAVLEAKPECGPVGWRGFMLGLGSVWYQFVNGRGEVIAINGAKEEIPEESIQTEWHYKGIVLENNCFTTIGLTGENYEEFHMTFAATEDFYIFSRFIGRYVGKQVPLSSASITEKGASPLAVSLPDCLHAADIERTSGFDMEQTYRILKDIPKSHCKSLAPNFSQGCEDLRLVYVIGICGGSMGCDRNTFIYGKVNDSETAVNYVVPLINFIHVNDALNFIDELGEYTANYRN